MTEKSAPIPTTPPDSWVTFSIYVQYKRHVTNVFVYADVITIEKTGEFFRLVYDVKGRFAIHRITAEEAKVYLL